jgi:hypothetical protein
MPRILPTMTQKQVRDIIAGPNEKSQRVVKMFGNTFKPGTPAIFVMCTLDLIQLYDSDIWTIYFEVCAEKIARFNLFVEARQLGVISPDAQRSLLEMPHEIDFDELSMLIQAKR